MVVKMIIYQQNRSQHSNKNTTGDKGEQLIWENINKILFSLYYFFLWSFLHSWKGCFSSLSMKMSYESESKAYWN